MQVEDSAMHVEYKTQTIRGWSKVGLSTSRNWTYSSGVSLTEIKAGKMIEAIYGNQSRLTPLYPGHCSMDPIMDPLPL